VTLTEDVALDAAARADRELAAGRDRGPLHGIPVAVKDVIDVSGIPTANGTAGLGWRLPQRDALAWATLRRAGAVLVGKTTTHELAWGATTPQCRNPIDITRVAGGSSGGSAVAVASGVVPVALGTDTGGSARLPAALCGTVGFRPATGSAPMPGITPLAPSQDTLGVLAASVADCELVATLLSRRRQTSARGATERFGVFDDEWASRTAPGVSAAFAGARMRLAEIGIEAEQVRLPMAALAPAASYVTMLSESARLWWPAARVHAEAIGDEVRALLRVGAGVTETDLARARDVSRAIRTGLSAAMKNASVDVCVLPTAPVTAHPLDATCAEINGREVPIEAAYVSFTALASVTGLAALSVPCGADENDLPVGLQVIAAPGREAAMWSFARRIEEISTAG
jgi:aspartyl-tRNA(Asn)/glutamyl-tRNA(Gln) amidotransferase subunit A